MAEPRDRLRTYRYALAALAISLGLHAALILGVRGQLVRGPELEVASFSAELVSMPEPVEASSPAPAPPPPRPPRPRSPRKPGEAIATLAPLAGGGSAADRLAELAAALAPLADPEPETPVAGSKVAQAPDPEAAKPEQVAAAMPATPIPALEPREFPVEALPARVSIRYDLSSPFADGRAEYSWSRDGDHYEINGAAEATGFFTLFLEGRILQESRGRVTPEGLQPDKFVERKPHGTEEGLTFDWANRRVEFRRNDEVKRGVLADRTVDWLSMIFQLAHRPPTGGSVALKVYTQRKLYAFELKVLGTEELQLPIGNVKALHLRHATGDPRETVDVWLGVDHHYLPVKLRYPVARNRFMVDQVATSITSR